MQMGIMSSIYNSDFNIEQLFLGSEEITEMYLGDQLVFSKITNNLFYKLHEFVGSLTVRNTVEAPVKSAILKGVTGYKDVDTGEILETFEEGRNLELVSVKMPVLTTTGKNLFSTSKLICRTGEYINAVKLEEGEYSIQTESTDQWESQSVYIPIKLKQGERIICYGSVINISNVRIFKNDFNTMVAYNNFSSIPTEYESFEVLYFAPEDCTVLVRFWLNGLNSIGYIKNIMIEINDTKTEYEPYKSNILTVNEDVTLRSNGDMCDELNLLTGQLTQRIGEDGVVLSEEVVKTVVLSSNKVYAYNGTTNYTCSSEEGSLIPTACIEVPVETETVE